MVIIELNGYSKKTDLACPKCAIDKLGKSEGNLVQTIQDRELETDKTRGYGPRSSLKKKPPQRRFYEIKANFNICCSRSKYVSIAGAQ